MEHDNASRVVIPKTDADRERIRAAVAENILFSGLDEDEINVVIDAMEKKSFTRGDSIITQGMGFCCFLLCSCFTSNLGFV